MASRYEMLQRAFLESHVLQFLPPPFDEWHDVPREYLLPATSALPCPANSATPAPTPHLDSPVFIHCTHDCGPLRLPE